MIIIIIHSWLTNAHHITVNILKVRRRFWCCTIPATVAKLMLAFFLAHFGARYNRLQSIFYEAFQENEKLIESKCFGWLYSLEIYACNVKKKLTANTRGLRAHIRRCSFDRCNEFLQISSWLWCNNAFGSNNPTFCNACKPKSL